MRHPRRPCRVLVAALAVLATAAGVAAAATPASARTAGTWVKIESTCAHPGDTATFRCFAKKLVDVPAHTRGSAPLLASVGHGYGGGMSPGDLATFYGYNRSGGSGQTVGIVIWGNNPYIKTDLGTFENHYKLPAETSTSFRVVNQSGKTSPLPNSSNALTGTHGEISLDVEAVRAVCAKCKILLVEASVNGQGSPSDASLAAAEDTAVRLGATVVTNSWGGPEYSVSSTLTKAFQHQGVVITASNGDDGWDGWDFVTSYGASDNAPSYPSTSQYVVAVGGTTITPAANGTRSNEVVWNSNGNADSAVVDGATGGGCSRLTAAPYFQASTPGYSALNCAGKRSGTDVAVDGDPQTGLSVYSKSEGGWARYGGTSLSSPLVAGMFALAGGSGGSSYPAASLYVNVNRLHKATFDVTSGANGWCGTTAPDACSTAASTASKGRTNNPNGIYTKDVIDCTFARTGKPVTTVPAKSSAECTATSGFDGPSGLGAVKGLSIFTDTSPGARLTGSTSRKVKQSGTYTAHLTPQHGARITSVTWLFGDGKKVTGKSYVVKHAWAKAGTYTVTFSACDSYGDFVLRKATIHVKK